MRLISMLNGRTSAHKGLAVVALAAVIGIASTGVAYADTLQDSITGNARVALVAGSPTGGTATINVNGNSAQQDPDAGCNWDAGDSPLVLDVVTPAGVTATPDPLSITECGIDHMVTFHAGASAVSGTATVSIVSTPQGGGTYNNDVSIPITVTQPANTPPVVSVTGVADNATYEAGAGPTPGCSVVDAEDTGESATPVITAGATNHHGLGTFTVTCSYTDNGPGTPLIGSGRADYTVVDTVKPTIGHTLTPASPNGSNGWYKSPVDVDFTCSDGGSGIQSCTGDTTLGNGANQSVTGIATDWAGNTTSDPVTGINVDGLAPNAPTASLSPAANPAGWNNTSVTVSFSNNGDNGASGVASCTTAVPVTAETGGQVLSGTCTDRAGNTSAPTAVTVKLDKTGPVISETVTVGGTPGNAGWYTSPVTVTFSGSDALSGPAAETKQATSSGDGLAVKVESPAFTDVAGNTTDAGEVTKTYKIDTVAPSVKAPVITGGTLGSNGWYTSAVTASFTAEDATSGVAGTNPQTVTSTTQGTGIVLSSPAFSDVAGNTTAAGNKSTTVKVDSLAPNAPTPSINPAANDDGWNNTNLVVHFAGNGDGGDKGSGVDSCTDDVPVTAETLADGQTVTGICTDNAGNVSETTTVTVKLDKTGPVVSETVDVADPNGSNGWYTTPVQVTFTANDALSGPASQTKQATSSGDGLAVKVESPAFTDVAGNTTDAGEVTKTYKIDTAAPSVGSPVLTGTLGDNNWYRSAVTASFTATDATSGVAGDNPKTVTSSQQGTAIVLSSPAFSDVAGNTTAAGNKSTTVKVDSLAPSVSLLGGPATGASYNFGSVPAAPTCGASDAAPGSGLADADGATTGVQECVVTGYSTAVGSHTLTATAFDNAGNKTTDVRTYTVAPWTLSGFYAPIDKGIHNTIKGGNTVPLKFEMFSGTTELTDVGAVASFVAQKINCDGTLPSDAVEVTSTGGTSLRYDTAGGQFIQNWKTPTTVGSCYKVTMSANDGSAISALFKIK